MVPHDGTNLARPTHPRQRLQHRSTPPLHPTTTPHTTQPTTHRRLPIPTIRHLRRRRNRTRIHPQQPRKPPHPQPHLPKTTPPPSTPPPPPMVLPIMGHLRQSNGQQNARNPRTTIHRSIPTTQRQNLTSHPQKIPIHYIYPPHSPPFSRPHEKDTPHKIPTPQKKITKSLQVPKTHPIFATLT